MKSEKIKKTRKVTQGKKKQNSNSIGDMAGALLRNRKLSMLMMFVLVFMVIYAVVNVSTLAAKKSYNQIGVMINQGDKYTNNPVVIVSMDKKFKGKHLAISEEENAGGGFMRPYSAFVKYTLKDGDGERKVYVNYYDEDRNSLGCFSDGIILDTVNPKKPNIFSPAKNIYIPQRHLMFRGFAEAENEIYLKLSSKVYRTYSDKKGYWGVRLPETIAIGDYEFCVWSMDKAGNKSETVCSHFTLIE